MASTQKKTSHTNHSKKSTAAKKTTKKTGTGKTKAPVYVPDLLARGIAAAVCVFLALLVALGMFGIHAVVPDLLCNGIRGLIGGGFWITALALLWAAGLLLFRRDRRVTLRLWCLGLLPVVGGSFLHVLLWDGAEPLSFRLVVRLWSDGVGGTGGGVISGGLGTLCATGFSSIGAGVIFALLFLVLLAGAGHVTPSKLMAGVGRMRQRRRERAEEYEDEYDDGYYDSYDDYDDGYDTYDREEDLATPRRTSFWPLNRRKRAPDLPLDDGPAGGPEKGGAESTPKAEALSQKAAPTPAAAPPEGVLPGQGGQTPADQAQETVLWQPPEEKKAPTKAQRQAALQKEADEVTQTIE